MTAAYDRVFLRHDTQLIQGTGSLFHHDKKEDFLRDLFMCSRFLIQVV